MQIPVNKDFLHEYKNEFWKGFTLPELISIGIGLSMDGGIVYLCWKYLHMAPNNAVYIGMPAMAPAIFVGFVKIQDNVNVFQYIKAIWETYKCQYLTFCGETTKPKTRCFHMAKNCADCRHNRKMKKGGKHK